MLPAGRVPDDERLFVSSSCMLLNVSFDDTFVPAFLNLSAVTPEIRAICGDNRECYFDVIQTGNTEIGEETKGFEEDTQAAIAELGNYCRKKKWRYSTRDFVSFRLSCVIGTRAF